MAAQGEREPGVVWNNVLGPMAQDNPEQDIVEEEQFFPPQMDPKPEMDAAAAEAAKYDTSPPHLHQIPSPAPSKTVSDNGGSVPLSPLLTQIVEAFAQVTKEEMRKVWGKTRHVGQCLQAGIMATPRAATNELEGSAPAGEDRVSWETCRARIATVTVTKWEKLIRVTETCTRERKEQLRWKARLRYAEIVKEQGVKQREGRERLVERARLTYGMIRERRQKEVETHSHEERLHGTDGVVGDAHTHTRAHTYR